MYIPLVRKYAIKNFTAVVGQPVVVKILKNSLFLNHIFSVYLFAGKHGCGKTSTARLFSTALNCDRLEWFQKDPRETLPCQTCQSCVAMQLMQHPDFIEIDAASHTGVDNVRLLIESATLLPLMGKKKIYLIDEAHMLSKAASNAFLKILEEPPKDVVFILATTVPEKILETVRSRCFQLFFNPIQEEMLIDYICSVADQERIAYARDGIARIVRMSKGSVRDALNMLDQTRLAITKISTESLEQVFGSVSDDSIFSLFELLFSNQSNDLFSFLQKIIPNDYSLVAVVFDRIVYCARALLWFLYGNHIADDITKIRLDRFVNVTPAIIIQFLSHLYQHESALKRSENPVIFFEVILLLFIQKRDIAAVHHQVQRVVKIPPEKQEAKKDQANVDTAREEFDLLKQVIPSENAPFQMPTDNSKWLDFLERLNEKNDPLLLSIFKQAVFQSFDQNTQIITLLFQKDRNFFADLLTENRQDWLPIIRPIFGDSAVIVPIFSAESPVQQSLNSKKAGQEQSVFFEGASTQSKPPMSVQETRLAVEVQEKRAFYKSVSATANSYFNRGLVSNKFGKVVDVSDRTKWSYAHLLQSVFPGIITEFEKGDS